MRGRRNNWIWEPFIGIENGGRDSPPALLSLFQVEQVALTTFDLKARSPPLPRIIRATIMRNSFDCHVLDVCKAIVTVYLALPLSVHVEGLPVFGRLVSLSLSKRE